MSIGLIRCQTTVTPGAPSLVFETPATGAGTASAAQTVGGCTQVTVARKDAFGNDVPLAGAAGDLTFTLPGGTTAHSGTPCGAGNVCDATGSCASCVAVTGYRQVSAGNGYTCAIDASAPSKPSSSSTRWVSAPPAPSTGLRIAG